MNSLLSSLEKHHLKWVAGGDRIIYVKGDFLEENKMKFGIRPHFLISLHCLKKFQKYWVCISTVSKQLRGGKFKFPLNSIYRKYGISGRTLIVAALK